MLSIFLNYCFQLFSVTISHTFVLAAFFHVCSLLLINAETCSKNNNMDFFCKCIILINMAIYSLNRIWVMITPDEVKK